MADFTSQTPDLRAQTNPAILQAFAQANQQRLQAQAQQNQFNQQAFENKMQVANALSGFVGNLTQAAVHRHVKNAVDSAVGVLAQTAPSQTVSTMAPDNTVPGPEAPQQSVPNPDYNDQMAQRQQARLTIARLMPGTELGSMAAQEALPKPVKPIVPQFETKQGTVNGQGMTYVVDSREGVPRDTTPQHNVINDKIAPLVASSPLADIRKQSLINTAGQQANKALDPSSFSPNTVAGKSAQVVANADSALGLAQQMRNKEVPITQQNMTSLAMDANRVLSQSSTTSEKVTQDLKAKTGFSTFQDALTYFTNHPQDEKLQPFVDIISAEMQRQRDLRQKVVDTHLQKALPTLNTLKRLSPQDWEDQIQANGFDLAAAKQGHLKVRPEIGSTLYGWDIGNTGNTPNTGQTGTKPPLESFGNQRKSLDSFNK